MRTHGTTGRNGSQGRKYQLQVHNGRVGRTDLNDRLYPALVAQAPADFSRPLQLLARTLRCIDPQDHRLRVFESRQALAWAEAGAGYPGHGDPGAVAPA